ncbi:MAG: preprotein translocase subunit YajC [Planctomycetota bacterium]
MEHSLLILTTQEGQRSAVTFQDGQAAQPAAGDLAATTVQDGTSGSGPVEEAGAGSSFWIMLVLLFGFMWFVVIRPENKRQKKRKSFQSELKKGDDVVTAGGLHGTIAAMDENTITLKVSDQLRLKFDRVAVSRNASAEADAAADKIDKK